MIKTKRTDLVLAGISDSPLHLTPPIITALTTPHLLTTPLITPSVDYYVKLCLCQHSRVIKTKRTDLVRGSSDAPHFNESFTFKLVNSLMDTYSVNVIVMQYKAGLKG